MGVLSDASIAFIGAGTMAEAIIRGLLREGLIDPSRLTASDPLEERRTYLGEHLGIATTPDNASAAHGSDIVVLAIKPQVVPDALPQLRGHVRPGALVISIIAGTRIATLEALCGARAIVRVMPNTPAQIGEGMSVWTATHSVTDTQREQVRAILRALGREVAVDHEDYVDMATALSGSGPAYVFLFMEGLIDAGVHMGLPRPVAEELVIQTVRGAAIYAQQSGTHPAVLRNMVTSPGGTTAEGLLELERGALRATLTDAVLAAYRQARSLGGTENA